MIHCLDRALHRADWRRIAFACELCGLWVCGWCEGMGPCEDDQDAADPGGVLCDECWHGLDSMGLYYFDGVVAAMPRVAARLAP